MTYRRGEIVWVLFPFTDGTGNKVRPALIVSNDAVNRTGDHLLVQVTSRLRNDRFSLSIDEEDFAGLPLRKKAELCIHKVFMANGDLIDGLLTSVSKPFMEKVVEKLIEAIS